MIYFLSLIIHLAVLTLKGHESSIKTALWVNEAVHTIVACDESNQIRYAAPGIHLRMYIF